MALTRRPSAMRAFRKRRFAAISTALVLTSLLASPAAPAAATDPVAISGSAVDSTGAPAAFVYIQAYTNNGPGRGNYVSQARTAHDGSFRIEGLTAGVGYRLFLNWSTCCGEPTAAPSHPGFFTRDPVDTMTQDPSRATLFIPGTSGLANLRLTLEPSTEITGRVMNGDGAPVEGAVVIAQPKTDYHDHSTWQGVPYAAYVETGPDGTFRLRDLEYVGAELHGHVVAIHPPTGGGAYVGRSLAAGLVPVDNAKLFPPVGDTTTIEVVLPDVRLPADQILLGPEIGHHDGGLGQIMAVGSGTLSVFSLRDGAIVGGAVRTGFDGQRVYAPGDWGGTALDWRQNANPGESYWETNNDIVTVDQRGDMYLYEGDGERHLRDPKRIGWGWSGYRVIPSGDLNRDGIPDLLAIDRDGYLKLYRGDGKGGFLYPYPRVGNGWNGYDLYSAGDLNRDGRNDILSVDGRGDLWMYAGNGNGTFQMRKKVGNGWGAYTLAAGADIDGYMEGSKFLHRGSDIVGRNDATGDLYLYSGRGDGTFATKQLIATGW